MALPAKYPSWRLNPIPVLIVSVGLMGLGLLGAFAGVHFWRVQIPTIGGNVIVPLLLGVLAVSLFIVGAVLSRPAALACGQLWRLKKEGRTCEGQVTGVKTRYVPRFGPEAYLTYSYRVPGEDRRHEAASGSLSTRQVKRWRVGDEIRIQYDPNDPAYAIAEVNHFEDGRREWNGRPLDTQQAFVLNSITANYAGACIAVGLLMAIFGGAFVTFGLMTARDDLRFHQEGVSTTASIVHLSWTKGRNAAYYVSFLYQDGTGASHYDKATVSVSDGRGLSVFGTMPILYLKSDARMNRVDLPGERQRNEDNGTVLPLFTGFIGAVGLCLVGVGWWSIRTLPFFGNPLRPFIAAFQRTH